jgi:hypothetical protein
LHARFFLNLTISGQFDEETGGPMLIDSEEIEETTSEEEEDPIITQFREVSEVRFPGEVGPLGDHRLCKIKCVDGKWIGPLCAMNEQEGMQKKKKLPNNESLPKSSFDLSFDILSKLLFSLFHR